MVFWEIVHIGASSRNTSGYLAVSKTFGLFAKEPVKITFLKTPFFECLLSDREQVLCSLFSFSPSLLCSYKLSCECLSIWTDYLSLQARLVLRGSKAHEDQKMQMKRFDSDLWFKNGLTTHTCYHTFLADDYSNLN